MCVCVWSTVAAACCQYSCQVTDVIYDLFIHTSLECMIIVVITNSLVTQSEGVSTSSTCGSEVAITVVVTILIECVLAVPVIAVILALWLKRR